jgi:2-methylcitrate dehydratase
MEGMTGPVDPLEGERGLFNTIGAKGTTLVALEAPDRKAAVTQTFLKRWAVADSCQIPVDAAVDLYGKLNGRTIESVVLKTYRKSTLDTAVRDRERWEPSTRESADHSMPVVVAMALCDGGVYPERLLVTRHERFRDDDVRRLVKNMKIDFDPEFNAAAPAVRSCSIEARCTDGSTVSTVHRQVAEELFRMGETELRAKFDQLTCDALRPADAERFLRVVDGLEGEPASALVDCLAI